MISNNSLVNVTGRRFNVQPYVASHDEALYDGYVREWLRRFKAKGVDSYVKLIESYPKINSNQLVGIEIECEGVDSGWADYCPPGWRWETDGSLKNNGAEFISQPVYAKLSPYLLANLSVAMQQFQRKFPTFGWRTSTHIHVDYSNSNMHHIVKTLLTYLVFENSLFEYASSDRKQSIFCTPLTETDWGTSLGNIISETWPANYLFTNADKYSAMNLRPLSTLGTIEYRHLSGAEDFPRIINWIRIILALTEFANRADYDELKREIIELNTSSAYQQFKNKVFGPELGRMIVDRKLARHMSDGVKVAKLALSGSSEIQIDSEKSQLYKFFHGLYEEYQKKNPPKVKTPIRSIIREGPNGRLALEDVPYIPGQSEFSPDWTENDPPEFTGTSYHQRWFSSNGREWAWCGTDSGWISLGITRPMTEPTPAGPRER